MDDLIIALKIMLVAIPAVLLGAVFYAIWKGVKQNQDNRARAVKRERDRDADSRNFLAEAAEVSPQVSRDQAERSAVDWDSIAKFDPNNADQFRDAGRILCVGLWAAQILSSGHDSWQHGQNDVGGEEETRIVGAWIEKGGFRIFAGSWWDMAKDDYVDVTIVVNNQIVAEASFRNESLSLSQQPSSIKLFRPGKWIRMVSQLEAPLVVLANRKGRRDKEFERAESDRKFGRVD